MSLPSFTSQSRLLLFAPHPDDESLACGVLLQQAVAAGAAVNVVYFTDGENNPWPQRCLSRRWRLNASDRQRWAKLRRSEALAALRILGVSGEDARFLGWPDQGLGQRYKAQRDLTLARLRYLISELSPTDVVGSDPSDRHPDHASVGAMLDDAFARPFRLPTAIARWTYIVHGLPGAFVREAETVSQSNPQQETKRRAIECHQTQLLLSRRRFLAYSERPELLRQVS